MIEMLSSKPYVVGLKQAKKAIRENKAEAIITAVDADPAVLKPVLEMAGEKGIEVVKEKTMRELGSACKIEVGAAVVAILKE